MCFRAKSVLFDILTIFIIIFIQIATELGYHFITPLPAFIHPWSEFSYTKSSPHIFRGMADSCSILVEDSEPIRACAITEVSYVATVCVLLEVVFHLIVGRMEATIGEQVSMLSS